MRRVTAAVPLVVIRELEKTKSFEDGLGYCARQALRCIEEATQEATQGPWSWTVLRAWGSPSGK